MARDHGTDSADAGVSLPIWYESARRPWAVVRNGPFELKCQAWTLGAWIRAMNDDAPDLDETGEDILVPSVSDEALEAAATTTRAPAAAQSRPFTYLSGMCC